MTRNRKRVSSGEEEQELRQFVAGLSGGCMEPREQPECLEHMAARVLSRIPSGADMGPDDLVAALVQRLLDGRQRSGPGALEALLEVDSLRGVLEYRMKQIASENDPGRSFRRELRAHVRRVLWRPLSGATAQRPETLLVHGRYRAERVRAAVAWALAQGVQPSLPELVRFLLAEYGLGVSYVEIESAPDLPICMDAEALVLARELRAHLGYQQARLVGRQLGGATLRELSEESGRKMTALHSHLHRLEAEVVAYVRASGSDPVAARAALRLLAEAA
ncbi:MAG: hypothetical protein L0Y66_03125 [Myxococcaceae bacterium]|nr:hypothetical protein [Myxococcaceae bacterium]